MIFSVGFVFAEDINQTNDNIEVADTDVISTQDVGTYADLSQKIEAKTDLDKDYAFNENDTIKKIAINDKINKNYVINGNNHTIDGNNKVGVFSFTNVAATINDLTIKNCGESAILVENSTLILNNVNFIDNHDNISGAAIYGYESDIRTNNCLFKDNYAPEGSAIYVKQSDLTTGQTTFTNKNPIHWALIYGTNSLLNIENTLFENVSSMYATAIYTEMSKTNVIRSKFSNLYANATAGAIGIKTLFTFILQDCTFTNVSSVKNGGAVYVDVNGPGDKNGGVLINHTLFDHCSSNYGGAVLQLGGKINIIYSNFTNNRASFSGGAVYTSNSTFYVGESDFINNNIIYKDSEIGNGGALFLDYGSQEIEYCNFIKNSANAGGGVYSYDSYIEVRESTFENNGEAIHGVFLNENSYYKDITTKSRDKFNLDDEIYATYVSTAGKEIVLNPIPVTGSVEDSSFDLRKFGAVTPVENQGHMGACWAFGTTGAFESAFLKATNITLDISNNNMQNSAIRYSIYGKPAIPEGGYIVSGLSYVLSWLGVLNTEDDHYDELGKISPFIFSPDSYHVTDAIIIDPKNITLMKDSLIKYGGLTAYVNGADPNNGFYNNKTYASYCNNDSLGNHFITIVGWDDNFSKSNFKVEPEADGAWICKNSWGTDWGDKGYFYLSYYDEPLRGNSAIGYIINNTDLYDNLYQYDIASLDGYYKNKKESDMIFTNKFLCGQGEVVAAVGTFFEEANQAYTINILVNGKQVYSQSGKSKFSGYETVKLNKYVTIHSGDEFSVQIKTKALPLLQNSRQFFEKGYSILNDNGKIEDLSKNGKVACVKAYTFLYENNSSHPTAYYNPSKTVIKSNYEGAKITVTQKGKLIGTATVKEGKATIDKKLTPGSYIMTTSYNDTEYLDIIYVEYTVQFASTSKIVMDYTSKTKCKVMVYDSNGNAVGKNKVVTFKMNKKSYKVKTNAKGYATFKIPTKTKPGTYKLTASYDGLTISKTVKVKHVLKASKKTVTVKKSAKKLVLKATLKTSKNKAIKNKKVSFKVNGKTYTSKTNKKGIVKVTVKKSAINKLKAGKKYSVKITYLKDTAKTTLKVKG